MFLQNQRLSCLLVLIGGFCILGSLYIIHLIMILGIHLKENTYLEQMWSVTPMPLYMEFYAYNWTNSEDINKPGIKPRFKEIGPFVFREIKEKGNVTWNQNGTVSFRQYHTYYFERDRSVDDLSLPITTLNPVLASAAYSANRKNYGFWTRKGLQVIFDQLGQKLAVTKPVGQYLFEGYPDSLLSLSTKLPIKSAQPFEEKFAWFLNRNATPFEGDFNMGTRFDNFGILEEWNHSNRTFSYEGTCGNLNGISAGELHRAYSSKEGISIFVSDLCRAIPLDFEGKEEVEGVLGWKYTAGERFLDNGTLYPENKCFCPGECLPSGVVNISRCKYDGPAFISFSNFYKADEYYLNRVEGLKPDASKHELYIILEPVTGTTLRVAVRIQLNLLLQPVKYISMFENVPKLIFPVLWFDEVAELPDFLLMPLKLFLVTPLILKIIGAILVFSGLYRVYLNSRFPRNAM